MKFGFKDKIILVITIIIISIILPNTVLSQTKKDIIKTSDNEIQYRYERYAIVIGINDYLKPELKLNYARKDAKDIKEVLEKYGKFTVNLITDKTNKKPMKNEIIQAVKSAKHKVEEGIIKTFVFFFSGHGFQSGKNNYIAPIEMDPNDIKNSGVNLDQILSLISDMKDKATAMVFLDACRSNSDGNEIKGIDTGFGEQDSKGLAILYSTKKDTPSYEDPKFRNGVYTYYLKKGLMGEADGTYYRGNNDGYVTFDEIKKYTMIKMDEWSRTNKNGKTQEPRASTSETKGEFIITQVEKKEDITTYENENNDKNNSSNSYWVPNDYNNNDNDNDNDDDINFYPKNRDKTINTGDFFYFQLGGFFSSFGVGENSFSLINPNVELTFLYNDYYGLDWLSFGAKISYENNWIRGGNILLLKIVNESINNINHQFNAKIFGGGLWGGAVVQIYFSLGQFIPFIIALAKDKMSEKYWLPLLISMAGAGCGAISYGANSNKKIFNEVGLNLEYILGLNNNFGFYLSAGISVTSIYMDGDAYTQYYFPINITIGILFGG